jgi:hypothetical protein
MGNCVKRETGLELDDDQPVVKTTESMVEDIVKNN